MNTRHLTAAVMLASALAVSACGNGSDTAQPGSSATTGGGHGSGHSSSSNAPADMAGAANEADIAFLTGMLPHHEQAVEMSDVVLAASAPAPVADIARQIKAAQDPEVEQMNRMLTDLGHPTSGGSHGAGHGGGSGGHAGMMSEAEMADLRAATGDQAARLFLEAMIRHHQGAIDAAETELAEGQYEPARTLATNIAKDQAAEISEMRALLASL